MRRLACGRGAALAILSLLAFVLFASPALAEPASPAQSLAPARLAQISENCTSIKQSLTQLQRADSRTRSYLGSSYETVATKFLSPLSLRLTKNNYSAPDIMNIQSEFSIAQSIFRSQYTSYMRDLENLLSTDCQAHPEEFSNRLDAARESRASLHQTTLRLNQLITEQITAVRALQEALHE